MNLDELIKDPEHTRAEKELYSALEIASREWEKIGISLEYCGDIGDFEPGDFMIGIIDKDVILRNPMASPTKSVSVYSPTYYPVYFVKNLVKMEDKFPDHGYDTTEALYSYVELAAAASKRIGLRGNLAIAFGAGYANVRTGWIAEKGWPMERQIFSKLFFEGAPVDYEWDFQWDSVKRSLRNVYDIFIRWKQDPELHRRETQSKAVVKPYIV